MAILMTAQQLLDAAFDELGLPRESIEPGAAGQNGIQAMALMNSLGDDLVMEHDWQFLQETATFNGDGVTSEFDLPADFGRIVDQTIWASSDRLPVRGPLSPQEWGWVQYGIVSGGVFFRYRILNDKIAVFPVPGVGETFNFFYIKKNWVVRADGTTYVDSVALPTDTPLFSRGVMKKGLKVRLWGQKGFDTTALSKEYDDDLAMEKAQSQSGPVINLSRSNDNILIDPFRNIPDRDWN